MSAARIPDEVLGALYQSESRSLIGMLWVFTGDRTLAEDLAQEAFVRLATSWGRVRDPARAPSYLRSIAFNLARGEFRRAGVARRQEPAVRTVQSAEIDALLNEGERAMVAALQQLPDRQRECVVLRYYLDLEPSRIASTLGLSVNSVKTHLRRGVDGLRHTIGDAR